MSYEPFNWQLSARLFTIQQFQLDLIIIIIIAAQRSVITTFGNYKSQTTNNNNCINQDFFSVNFILKVTDLNNCLRE
jgi:hypothetical protein